MRISLFRQNSPRRLHLILIVMIYTILSHWIPSQKESYKPWLKEDDTDENNEKAKKAYEALMTVTVPPPPRTEEYLTFDQEVKRNAKEKFNFSFGDESVNPFVSAFYDAVLLYAIAVNETLEANGSIENGTEITRRMRGKTFQGNKTSLIHDNGHGILMSSPVILTISHPISFQPSIIVACFAVPFTPTK